MKTQKYVDMAYRNPRGIEWLNLIHQEDIWNKWSQKVESYPIRWKVPDPDRPSKVLIAAIWHFGYAHDSLSSGELRRTALRLRRGDAPPEWGVGASKRGFSTMNVEIWTFGMPVEFWLLDNFLENEVRPLMDSSTKTEG